MRTSNGLRGEGGTLTAQAATYAPGMSEKETMDIKPAVLRSTLANRRRKDTAGSDHTHAHHQGPYGMRTTTGGCGPTAASRKTPWGRLVEDRDARLTRASRVVRAAVARSPEAAEAATGSDNDGGDTRTTTLTGEAVQALELLRTTRGTARGSRAFDQDADTNAVKYHGLVDGVSASGTGAQRVPGAGVALTSDADQRNAYLTFVHRDIARAEARNIERRLYDTY